MTTPHRTSYASTVIDDPPMKQPLPAEDADQVTVQERPQRHSMPPKGGSGDPWEVHFDPNDPANPKNWSRAQRWYLTMSSGLLVLNATFASSAPAGVVMPIIEDFHISREVATLMISLFVAGYCVGPLLWGPLSEQYGRRPIFIISFIVYTCFQVGCALSPNTGALLAFRFLGGTFAAAPLGNSGAVISDIWDAKTRGTALAVFTLAPFAGPSLGPTVAGYIALSGTSWRWVFWVMAFFAGSCLIMIIFTMPETYSPLILVWKARQKRKETGDERWYAPMERQHVGFVKRLENIIMRPFRVLFREPMLIAITIYMSFVYGCLYLLFEAYPIVFTEGHHFNSGVSGLVFLPILVGGAVSVLLYLLIFNPRYERQTEKYAPAPPPPEVRLEICIIAAPFYAISFFWFAWTSNPSISFWAPMLAGGLMGFSIAWIFLGLFNYMIDAYLFVAASALAANTVARSIFGAAFPLFATQMYDALGPEWASSLLGFVAAAMIPIPFVLVKFGPVLRKNSKYAPTKPDDTKQPDAETAEEEVEAREKQSEKSPA